jgi:uncharacterized membrane protein YqjE
MLGSMVRLLVIFQLFIMISLSVLFLKLIIFVIWPSRKLIEGLIFCVVFLIIFLIIISLLGFEGVPS